MVIKREGEFRAVTLPISRRSGPGAVILPLAVIAQLAAACAPQVAPETLAAVAQTESGRDPLAIGDNTTHRSYRPHDVNEAATLAHDLMAKGHDLDLGLMQINRGNFTWLGLTVEAAFDPCRSIAAGAAVLTQLSRYNTGSPTAGFRNGYVARVLAADQTVKGKTEKPAQPAAPDPPPPWNVFPDSDPPAADQKAADPPPWLEPDGGAHDAH
jgi:type IV secretion system protein VirB1